jgi:hypothetical protein
LPGSISRYCQMKFFPYRGACGMWFRQQGVVSENGI